MVPCFKSVPPLPPPKPRGDITYKVKESSGQDSDLRKGDSAPDERKPLPL